METRPFLKKRLGQCLLTDRNMLALIVRTVDPRPDDLILEVGAGTGNLTEPLVERAGFVVAVELDPRLSAEARRRLGDRPNLSLLEGDVLAGKRALAPGVLDEVEHRRAGRRFRIASNLPYAISVPFLTLLLESRLAWHDMVVLVQREVADRLMAGAGGRDYGAFSVKAGLWSRIEKVRDVPPQVFTPRPRVDSTLVRLVPTGRPPPAPEERAALDRALALVFEARRKTLLRAMERKGWARPRAQEVLARLGLEASARGEELEPERFLELAREVGVPGSHEPPRAAP